MELCYRPSEFVDLQEALNEAIPKLVNAYGKGMIKAEAKYACSVTISVSATTKDSTLAGRTFELSFSLVPGVT